MSEFKLYEITEMYNNLTDLDLEDEQLEEALKNVDDELEIKADNIAKVLKNLDAEINALKEEEKRLQSRRKAKESRADNLKKYLQMNMEAMDKKKFKTALFSFNIQKNRASVDILDENKIPEDYYTIEKKFRKADLLEAYNKGLFTDALKVERTESLRIR